MLRAKKIEAIKDFINPENSTLYLSIVSEGELRSLSIRNKWGGKRVSMLNTILDLFDIIDVNKSSITSYSQIDAYSQRINPSFETFSFESARNMGKNDLWIASLAALLNLKLVTTDSDFDHLNNVFIEVRKINPLDFVRFF